MDHDYTIYEATKALCSVCEIPVDGRIVLKADGVYIQKFCPEHGEHLALLESSVAYHLSKKNYDKPGTDMKRYSQVKLGCPFDCGENGVCTQHGQHACIGLIEVTSQCNMKCTFCYAPMGEPRHIPLEKIEAMMDFYIDSEGGEAEILQISGGEPSLHPDIFEIIRMARRKAIKYVMLNTNGVKIAEDERFAKALAEFKGKFEVYLQFDGFSDEMDKNYRGNTGVHTKLKAIENLSKYGVPVTLVSTLLKGINEGEIGKLFKFAVETPYVRGINFQPIAFFGCAKEWDKSHRMTISEVIEQLEVQTNGIIRRSDVIPLPCNSDRIAISYLYKNKSGSFIPIMRNKKINDYIHMINNTFVFTVEEAMVNAELCQCFKFFKDFKEIIPWNFNSKTQTEKLDYVNNSTFRISISSFVDHYNFDLRSMQKECVHVITEDLKKIPFSAYNMFHRK